MGYAEMSRPQQPTKPTVQRRLPKLSGMCLCGSCAVDTMEVAPMPSVSDDVSRVPRQKTEVAGPALVEAEAALRSIRSELAALQLKYREAVGKARALVAAVWEGCGLTETYVELPNHILHVEEENITIARRVVVVPLDKATPAPEQPQDKGPNLQAVEGLAANPTRAIENPLPNPLPPRRRATDSAQ